jgi:hypothetical protein
MVNLSRRIALAASISVMAATAFTAAAAQAKKLVLSTPASGPVSSLDATMTSTAGSLFLEGEECGTRWPGILRWKFKVQEAGSGFTGSVSGLNEFACMLPSGAGVTIEPDPHPWSIKLTPAGKALIKGNGQKVELLAHLPGEECVYGAGKINMIFVVAGPLHPVPLEPGDPVAVRYNLIKGLSAASCPKSASETLSFKVTTGDPAGEEVVFDEA